MVRAAAGGLGEEFLAAVDAMLGDIADQPITLSIFNSKDFRVVPGLDPAVAARPRAPAAVSAQSPSGIFFTEMASPA
jgi:hypothetical protein